jgi:predicted transcriptional regulator
MRKNKDDASVGGVLAKMPHMSTIRMTAIGKPASRIGKQRDRMEIIYAILKSGQEEAMMRVSYILYNANISVKMWKEYERRLLASKLFEKHKWTDPNAHRKIHPTAPYVYYVVTEKGRKFCTAMEAIHKILGENSDVSKPEEGQEK